MLQLSNGEKKVDSLSERLRHSLEQQDASIPTLAAQIGVTKQSIYNVLNSETTPDAIRAMTLFPLARALRVSPEWLLYGTASADGSTLAVLDPTALLEAEAIVLEAEVERASRFLPKERAHRLASAYARVVSADGTAAV